MNVTLVLNVLILLLASKGDQVPVCLSAHAPRRLAGAMTANKVNINEAM